MDIKKITLGVLHIEEKDGVITFSRFGEEQRKKLIKRGEIVAAKVCCTASVKLEFYTKGGKISFDYEITPGTKREHYSIDLLVDKVYQYCVSKDKNEDSNIFIF